MEGTVVAKPKESTKGGPKGHQFSTDQRSKNEEEWKEFTNGIPESQEVQFPQAQVLGGQESDTLALKRQTPEEQAPQAQVPEEQAPQTQAPEGQVPEGKSKMSPEQINWILFSFGVNGRFSKNVIELMKEFGLPIPAQGSLSSSYLEGLIFDMKTIFIRRIPQMSFEEIKYFLKQLTSQSTLGDENNVVSFPNDPDSKEKEKFHTLHLECAKEILRALLEQSRTLDVMISECMTLKLDGSCAVINEEGRLAYAGRGLLIHDEVQVRLKSSTSEVAKLSVPLPEKMPETKKSQKRYELEQTQIKLAYFKMMLSQVEEIEKSKPKKGTTYEIFFLGRDMNDLRTALFPIISGRTIISHDELMILLIQQAQPAEQDPSAQPKPVEDFLNMTKAEILALLNEKCMSECMSKINAGRHSTGRPLFSFQPVRILMNEKPKNGVPPTPKYSSVCEGGVLHITVVFPDGTVLRICLKVKNPEMNQEKRDHCIYSETFTEADYYALLKEWLIPAEVPAVLPSAGGGQAGEP